MAIDPYASPYVPNLVPTSRPDDEAILEIINLQRFLKEELDRIQEGLAFVPVQAAYGALTVDPGPAPDQPLPKNTITPITGFNNIQPAVPNRIEADAAAVTGDELVPLEGGVYFIQSQLTVDIDPGTTYTISVSVNGVVSAIFGRVDASNQTAVITLSFYGLATLNPGDVVILVALATAAPAGPFQFIILSGTFSLIRVSEQHSERV